MNGPDDEDAFAVDFFDGIFLACAIVFRLAALAAIVAFALWVL